MCAIAHAHVSTHANLSYSAEKVLFHRTFFFQSFVYHLAYRRRRLRQPEGHPKRKIGFVVLLFFSCIRMRKIFNTHDLQHACRFAHKRTVVQVSMTTMYQYKQYNYMYNIYPQLYVYTMYIHNYMYNVYPQLQVTQQIAQLNTN